MCLRGLVWGRLQCLGLEPKSFSSHFSRCFVLIPFLALKWQIHPTLQNTECSWSWLCNEVAGFLCNHWPISWHHCQPVLANSLWEPIFHIQILCIVYFFCVAGRMLFIIMMAECRRNQSMSSMYFTLLRCLFQTDFLVKSCIQVISLQYCWTFVDLKNEAHVGPYRNGVGGHELDLSGSA